jgi:hypothetical protein
VGKYGRCYSISVSIPDKLLSSHASGILIDRLVFVWHKMTGPD